MKATHLIVTGFGLLLTSLQSSAQEARPPAPPAPVSTPAPIAIPHPDGSLSCAYCDLRGKDLTGKNLTNANLVGSDLRGAKLAGATLDGAILIGANLAGADLSGAHFGATSNGPADLTNANLATANLNRAVLTGANLLFAGLEGADFSGADLTGAVLGPHPKLGTRGGRRTSFRGARLERRFAPGPTTADLDGVTWIESKIAVAAATTAGIVCSGSDLSRLDNPIYVSTKGTDSANCGASPALACQSLAHALSRCTLSSCNVLAMYDEFTLTGTLVFDPGTTPGGARLYGGCVPSGQADPALRSLLEAPPDGIPAVSVTGVKPVVLENFKILGSTAAGSSAMLAVTVQIAEAPEVVLINSMVVGGKGGTGATGAAQPAGAQGGNASGRTAGVNNSCVNVNGGPGVDEDGPGDMCIWRCLQQNCTGGSGSPGSTSHSATGGPSGKDFRAEFHVSCTEWSTPNDAPDRGVSGNNADCGTGGTASTNLVGGFKGTTWEPGTGGSGKPGGDAGGGGGGGRGGGYWGQCDAQGDYHFCGSSGGGGGAGGCGGPPGPGGQQGGASFAIVAAAGSVLKLNQSRVVAGRGGDGGVGGVGGNGGGAGAYAVGAGVSGNGPHGGRGGDGGDGGTGGGGGGGAGGNGGPSAAVALVGGAKVDGTATYYYIGSSGNFGGGGAGGTSILCPSGPSGNPGVFGSVADTLTYP